MTIPPITLEIVGISPRIKYARMVEPMGSPNKAIET